MRHLRSGAGARDGTPGSVSRDPGLRIPRGRGRPLVERGAEQVEARLQVPSHRLGGALRVVGAAAVEQQLVTGVALPAPVRPVLAGAQRVPVAAVGLPERDELAAEPGRSGAPGRGGGGSAGAPARPRSPGARRSPPSRARAPRRRDPRRPRRSAARPGGWPGSRGRAAARRPRRTRPSRARRPWRPGAAGSRRGRRSRAAGAPRGSGSRSCRTSAPDPPAGGAGRARAAR